MSKLFQGRMFLKPRNQIINELRWIFEKHDVKEIHFSDDNAFRNNADAQELCSIVRSATSGRNVFWRCATRIDTLSRLSDNTYKSLVSSGCKGFSVGIESGVDAVLKAMGKNITISQIQDAVAKILKYNFHENLFFFLFNFNGETKQDAGKTLKLACTVQLLFPSSDIAIYTYFPLMSDSEWITPNISVSKASRLSEVFINQAKTSVKGKAAGIDIKVLQFFFSASKKNNKNTKNKIARIVLYLYKKALFLRMRYCFFRLPLEYYMHRLLKSIFIKKKTKVTN